MSQLLDKLLTPSQRSEVTMADRMLGAPLTIPAPRSVREQTLMADNAALRIRIEALEARNDELARKVALMGSELRTLKGDDAMPSRGCRIASVRCDQARVLVEYDYTPAEEAVMDPNSPVCGPGHSEEIEPLRVFINGHWCDLSDVLSDLSDDALIERINKEREE